MNLSCGKCKTIRPFSGNPPRCDVCGWVCGTESISSMRKASSLSTHTPQRRTVAHAYNKAAEGVAKAVLFLVKIAAFWFAVAAVIYVCYLIFASDQTKLASEYGVTEDHVFVQPKPHGCDFDDAPLGNKHCHYEKHVEVERACPGPDCRVTSVYVSWSKIDE